MIKYILILLVLLVVVSTKSETLPDICSLDPLYCQIIKNNPRIKVAYARRLANAIDSMSKKYHISSSKYAAILAQESMYKLNAKNCTDDICHDYGIAQINRRTAKAYGFDLNRLTTDLEYSIEAGAIVLADLKKSHGKHEKDFWTRYNASTAHKREKYKMLVARYM